MQFILCQINGNSVESPRLLKLVKHNRVSRSAAKGRTTVFRLLPHGSSGLASNRNKASPCSTVQGFRHKRTLE